MTSYLVLTPPGAARGDERARFIADRFSWMAFIFPAIWLLVKRQWLAGIGLGILQVATAVLTTAPEAMLAGVLIELSLRMLVALEGPVFVARRLEAREWVLQAVVTADDLATAEMIYDTQAEATAAPDSRPLPAMPAATAKPANGWPAQGRPAFGLFETYGER